MSLPLPAPGALQIQPLFPVALGQVQLRPDPLDLARQLQALLELRGDAESNPDPGCAWTGDLNGVWQLQHHPLFAPLLAEIGSQAQTYLAALGFDLQRVALHIQRCWPVLSESGQVNELVPGMAVGHGGPFAPSPWTQPWQDVAPRAGLLLLFPACLDHAVLPNDDDDMLRCSIAVDFALTAVPAAPGATPPEYLAPHPSQWTAITEDGGLPARALP